MMQACCLMLKRRVQLSASFVFLFIPIAKAELPLSLDLFFYSVMTKALHPCECVIVCFYPRAYTCLHHQVAHAANPRPAGDFPWCSGAAQCVTDLRVGDSSGFGWQTRCVLACCRKCDSLRPTWHKRKKNQADIYLILYSFASFQLESFWPWFHASVSWAISW